MNKIDKYKEILTDLYNKDPETQITFMYKNSKDVRLMLQNGDKFSQGIIKKKEDIYKVWKEVH